MNLQNNIEKASNKELEELINNLPINTLLFIESKILEEVNIRDDMLDVEIYD